MQFSIIIPAKNEEKNIGRCVDSIQCVKWDKTEFEIIVVDNGSSDRTVDIVRDKGTQVFVRPSVTVSALRNFGAGQSSGGILVFQDADCAVPENWLEEASRYLERRDVVCFGSPPGIPSGANWVQRAWYQVRRKERSTGDAEWLSSMNMFVRKEAFESVGGFREDLVTCEDYDLSLRLRKRGRIVYDHRIVAVHYGEASSLRHFWRKERWRGTSNLKGVLSHGFSWSEAPSLLLPAVHSIATLLAVACLLVGLGGGGQGMWKAVLLGAAVWQAPLLGLALWKARGSGSGLAGPQLYVLLNIYFLARGASLIRGARR